MKRSDFKVSDSEVDMLTELAEYSGGDGDEDWFYPTWLEGEPAQRNASASANVLHEKGYLRKRVVWESDAEPVESFSCTALARELFAFLCETCDEREENAKKG